MHGYTESACKAMDNFSKTEKQNYEPVKLRRAYFLFWGGGRLSQIGVNFCRTGSQANNLD